MREPLVLIPGMMCDARVFGPQINDLSRDHTVIVATPTQGETVREMASRLLDQLPSRFALAGLSLGGIVAMEMARRAPDRVNRLALISTSPLADTPAQAAWREPQIVHANIGRLDQAMSEAFSGILARGTGARTETRRDHGSGVPNGPRYRARGLRAPVPRATTQTGRAARATTIEGADNGDVWRA